jgi:hypothetical protein
MTQLNSDVASVILEYAGYFEQAVLLIYYFLVVEDNVIIEILQKYVTNMSPLYSNFLEILIEKEIYLRIFRDITIIIGIIMVNFTVRMISLLLYGQTAINHGIIMGKDIDSMVLQ